jgi:hypothetical protein
MFIADAVVEYARDLSQQGGAIPLYLFQILGDLAKRSSTLFRV